jgi:ABC-2 type transport system ATP-binding protein
VQDEGLTVLVSTAYLDEAQRCEEVIILHEGHILGTGAPEGFLKPLAGRVFLLRAPQRARRSLQRRIAKEPTVAAATLEAKGVRVLVNAGDEPSFGDLSSSGDEVEIEQATPRFEDGFIAMMRSQQHDKKLTEPDTSEPLDPRGLPGTSSDDVIEVEDVSRRFGSFYAVKNVSFNVQRGEVFGLLGANGAGKSTTFRMLCGLLPATSGRLRVSGVDLRRAAATARRQIGYMAQKFSLYGKLSIRENLNFFSRAYGLSGRRQRECVSNALEQFGLEHFADVASGELPLGYKQRLSMACALMHEPQIVFLDEPTSGVDPLARKDFWDQILRLADAGVTIMVTTHFMNEAEYCDRIAIMNAGEILVIDTPEKIRQRVRTSERPDPTVEEAFVQLIEETRSAHEQNR